MRVPGSTSAGSWDMKSRITVTCSAPISPRACAAAVAASWGSSGSPVTARRGPSAAASAIRRPASGPLIPSRLDNTARQDFAPISIAEAWDCA